MVYTNLLRHASEAFLTNQYCTAAFQYKMVFQHLSKACLPGEEINKYVVQYMLCLSLMESISLDDLEDALGYLINLEKNAGNVLPVVYYALAKMHIKFFRFDSAVKTINKGFAVLNQNAEPVVFSIPETNQLVQESGKEGLLAALIPLKDECTKWHRPDAVCCMISCQKSTRHYPPSRDIFFSDPSITGVVTITCTNVNPCTIKYHKDCWTFQKLKLYASKELSDNDILGYECFTLGCIYDGVRSKIAKIEVFDKRTNRLILCEAPTSNTPGVYLSSVKGAIKKKPQDVTVAKQLRRPHHFVKSSPQESSTVEQSVDEQGKSDSEINWRIKNLAKLREENFGISPEENWRPDKGLFGNEVLTSNPEFAMEPVVPENDANPHVKIYLFDVLHEYIKNETFVMKSDVIAKWEELSSIINQEDAPVTNPADIIEFLLSSPKIVMIQDYMCVPEKLPHVYATLQTDTVKDFKDLILQTQRSKQDATDFVFTEAAYGKENRTTEHNKTKDKQSITHPLSNGSQTTERSECNTTKFAKNGTVPLTPLNPFADLLRDEKNCDISKTDEYALRTTASKGMEDSILKSLINERDELRKELKISQMFSKNISQKCTTLEQDRIVMEGLLKSKRESECDAELLLTEKSEALEAYKERYKWLIKDSENCKLELAEKENELKVLKEKHLAEKRAILEKMLHHQYFSNKLCIYKNIQDCQVTLEVISKFNYLFEENLKLSHVLADDKDWLKVLTDFEKLRIENDEGYTKLMACLKSDQYVTSCEDIVLIVSNAPLLPGRTLREIVAYAFNKYTQIMIQCLTASQIGRRYEKTLPVPVPQQLLCSVPRNAYLYPQQAQILNQAPVLLPNFPNVQIECNNNVKTMHSPPANSPKPNDTSNVQNGTGSVNGGNCTTNEETRNASEESDASNSPKKNTNDEASGGQSPNSNNQGLKRKCEDNLGGENDVSQEHSGLLNHAESNDASCNNTNVEQSQVAEKESENGKTEQAENNNAAFPKQIDKLMMELRTNYTGIMDLDLLESLQVVKEEHKGSLSGLPLKVIIEEAGKYILLQQGKYLSMYDSQLETLRPNKTGNGAAPKSAKKQEIKPPLKSSCKKPAKNATFQIPAKPNLKVNKASSVTLETRRKLVMPVSMVTAGTSAKKVPQVSTPTKCPWNLVPQASGAWKKEGPESECIICMESTKNMSNPVYTLTCQHSFHKSCIKAWFQQNQSCPTCRVHCTIDDEFPPLPS